MKSYKKEDGENRGLTKNIINMRAVITTSAPRLGEEGNKTIQDLKRQMVLLKEENIKLFNERKKIKKILKRPSKTGNIWRLSNDILNQQDIQIFTCKTFQNNFIDKNELVHHRKCDTSVSAAIH